MIKFSYEDDYLICKTKDQSERLSSETRTMLKSSGFYWDKNSFQWKCFGLFADENIIEQAKFIDDVEGSIRSFRSFRRSLEEKEWVPKLDVKFDRKLLKQPPLYRSQIRAISNFISYEGFIGNLGVGHGKSYEAISAFNHLQHNKIVDKLLIITVSSVVLNWADELEKFSFLNEEDIFVFDSKKNRDPWSKENINKKVIICSYDNYRVLINDIYKKKGFSEKAIKPERRYCYHEEFTNWSENFMLVVDESHWINNNSSKNNKFIIGISQIARHNIALSGSLFRKFTNEIYFQMNLIAPQLVDNFPSSSQSYQRFLNATATLASEHSSSIVSTNEEKMNYLMSIYSKYIMKGKAHLKVKVDFVKILVKLSEKHMKFYETSTQVIMANSKKDDEGLSSASFLNSFSNYSQALSDPSMLIAKYPEELGEFDWKLSDNEKFKATLNILNEHKEDKVLLWIENPFVIDVVAEKLKKYKPLVYHGRVKIPKGFTKNEYKHSIVKQFNENDNHRLLICNPASLSTGANLQGANIDIFWTISSNVIEGFLQAIGRVARPSQTKDIIHYMLVGHKTIDETAFHSLTHRSYINDLKNKYKYLSIDQIRGLLTGKILE